MADDYTKDYLPYIAHLLQRAVDRTLSDHDQAQSLLDYFEAIDALAEDRLADVEDRKFALEIQVQNSAHFRLFSASAVAALAVIANSETTDLEEREEAKSLLKRYAEHLRERGTDISHWVESGSDRMQ